MKELKYEFRCKGCGHEWVAEDPYQVFNCPECKCDRFFTAASLTCHCGEEVSLSGFTNTCRKCDNMYNRSGQGLAPVSDWLPDY